MSYYYYYYNYDNDDGNGNCDNYRMNTTNTISSDPVTTGNRLFTTGFMSENVIAKLHLYSFTVHTGKHQSNCVMCMLVLLVQMNDCWLFDSFVRSFVRTFVRSFIHSFIH